MFWNVIAFQQYRKVAFHTEKIEKNMHAKSFCAESEKNTNAKYDGDKSLFSLYILVSQRSFHLVIILRISGHCNFWLQTRFC